ncbi:6-carboxytetrahydropterin synthase QueD [Candidatus Peregrinibacteria bacterium]|nr:MAG: 6-carboxytetrahydropterin synthase QueD [Candidatus Peregrinibacteria bacterium]
MFLITKIFSFAAAHHLIRYHGKCERPHGHNYRLEISVLGEKGENDLVLDFVLLKKLVKDTVLSRLDHHNLNDFFDNPTAEVIAEWIWHQLFPLSEKLLPYRNEANFPEEIINLLKDPSGAKIDDGSENIVLFEVKLWETDTSIVLYRGPHGNF